MKMKTKTMTTQHIKSIGRSPLRLGLPRVQPLWIIRGFILIRFAFTSFAVSPRAQAVSPAPDGCNPGLTTAEGWNAVELLTTGAGNTGVGWGSLQLDTTGSFNTGVGAGALLSNNGDSNTAVGAVALLLNTSGIQNTAVGADAMVHNDTGSNNTAVGAFALANNSAGV